MCMENGNMFFYRHTWSEIPSRNLQINKYKCKINNSTYIILQKRVFSRSVSCLTGPDRDPVTVVYFPIKRLDVFRDPHPCTVHVGTCRATHPPKYWLKKKKKNRKTDNNALTLSDDIRAPLAPYHRMVVANRRCEGATPGWLMVTRAPATYMYYTFPSHDKLVKNCVSLHTHTLTRGE